MLRTVCSFLFLVLLVGAGHVDAGAEDVMGRPAVTLSFDGKDGADFNATSGGACGNPDQGSGVGQWLDGICVLPAEAPTVAAPPASAPVSGQCQVGEWGPISDCTRTSVGKWTQSRTRVVVADGPNCPTLAWITDCVPPAPEPPTNPLDRASLAVRAFIRALPQAFSDAFVANLNAVDASSVLDRLAATPSFDNEKLMALLSSDPSHEAHIASHLILSGHEAEALVAATGDAVPTASAVNEELKPASGVTVSASLVFADDRTYGVTIGSTLSGAFLQLSQAAVGLALNNVKDLVYGREPWLVFQDGLEPSPSDIFSFNVSYNTEDKSMTLEASTGNYLFLLNAFADKLEPLAGIKLPNIPFSNQDTPTLSTKLVVDASQGLRVAAIGLGQRWTTGSLASRLGFSWPLADDLVAVSNPMVVYVASPGGSIPPSLSVAMTVDIPQMNIYSMEASLSIQPNNSLSLKLSGNVNIIPDKLVLQQVSLDVVKDVGLQVATAGTFLEIPVAISAHVPNNKKSQFSVALTATDVNLANVLTNVQESLGIPKIPGILLDFVRPISFTDITIAYGDPEAPANQTSVLTIAATPSISDVPVLKASAEFLGLSPDDFFFALGYDGLDLGVNHTSIISLPKPFTKDGVVLFSLLLDAQTSGASSLSLGGSFESAIAIPGASSPVAFRLSAAVALESGGGGGKSPDVTLMLGGAMLSPLHLEAIPFITIEYLSCDATLGKGPTGLTLNALSLTFKQQLFGASMEGVFVFDSRTGQLLFVADLENLDLETAINSFGYDVHLGPLSLSLSQAHVRYEAPSPGAEDPGSEVSAKMNLFGMQADISYKMAKSGVAFSVKFDRTQFEKVFKEKVIKKVTDAITSAQRALQDRQKDNAYVENAKRTLREQQTIVDRAQADYNKVYEPVKRAMDDAKAKVDQAQRDVEDFRNGLQAKLRQAEKDYQAADNAFNQAKNDVNRALASAQADVASAQRSFEDARNSAQAGLNSAQAKVNSLSGDARRAKDRCGWKFWNCAAYAAIQSAQAVATGALEVARAAANGVMRGSQAVALETAKGALSVAQGTANGVLSGSQWSARQGALAGLEIARQSVDAMASSSQFATLQVANGVLAAAQVAVNGVLQGAEAAAFAAAKQGLQTAADAVVAADKVQDAALEVANQALNVVPAVLEAISGDGFIDLRNFGFEFEVSKQRFHVGGSYVIAIDGKVMMGAFEIDIQDPLQFILNKLKETALEVVKSTYKELAIMF